MAEEYLSKINNAVSTVSDGINTGVSVKDWVNPFFNTYCCVYTPTDS